MNEIFKKRVLILRGGYYNHSASILTGAELIEAFSHFGVQVVDIYVDAGGVWHRNGVPVEPHATFSEVDAYIDLAHGKEKLFHHKLAKDMGLMKLCGEQDDVPSDRETTFRILRQHDILVPDTIVFRKGKTPIRSELHRIWRTMLTPLCVRDVHGKEKGMVATSLSEFEGIITHMSTLTDLQILSLRDKKPRTVVVLPNYRGEEYYVPLPVETQSKKYEMPGREHRIMPLGYLREEEKKELANFGRKVYKTFSGNNILLIDCLETPKGYMAVEVSHHPNFFKGGRLYESIATTGVSLAHYFTERLSKKQDEQSE